jgi:hypothetical protein
VNALCKIIIQEIEFENFVLIAIIIINFNNMYDIYIYERKIVISINVIQGGSYLQLEKQMSYSSVSYV